MVKKVDAVNGRLVKLIFIYTIPIILTTILQQLFDIADKTVLGHMSGTVAVAAVGATGTISTLILSGATGLSTGASIILARYVGQKNEEKIRQTIDTSAVMSIFLGAVIGTVGIFLTPNLLTAINCPADCYGGAVTYLRIYFAATPATLFYNYGAAILRTLGDTKKPLLYITVAGVVNLALNITLCFILENKVAAVAIATVASKVVSAALVFGSLCRLDEGIRLQVKKIRFKVEPFVQILRFGIPGAVSNLILPVSNLQISAAINSYGVDAVAGFSASASINSVVHAFSGGFGIAATTFIGQNLGAKNPKRVKSSFWYIIAISSLITGSLGILTYLTGEIWLAAILGKSATAAIEYGKLRMLYVSLFMVINAVNGVLAHALQAFGYPLFTSISNIAFTLGFRTFWMQLVYPKIQTFSSIMLCFTVSWSLNMLLYAVFFGIVFYRYIKYGKCKKI